MFSAMPKPNVSKPRSRVVESSDERRRRVKKENSMAAANMGEVEPAQYAM